MKKRTSIMTLIPYEQFEINSVVLAKLTEHYTNRKIKDYYNAHGTLPSSGMVESFTIPSKLMEEYKKYYYAQYYKDVLTNNEQIEPQISSAETWYAHISKGPWTDEEEDYYNQNWQGLNGLHYDVVQMSYNAINDYYYINNIVIPQNSVLYPNSWGSSAIGCEIIIRRDTEIYSQPLNFVTSEGLVHVGLTDLEHGKSYGYQYSPFYLPGEQIDEIRMSFYQDEEENFVRFVAKWPNGDFRYYNYPLR